MKLKIFKTLWGVENPYVKGVDEAINANFGGIEGPAPELALEVKTFRQRLDDNDLGYIAEITTAGSYVPDRNASLRDHLDSLEMKIENSMALNPLFITCLGGCDAWNESVSLEFFSKAMDIVKSFQIEISFETHRGRSLYNPWTTQRIVEQLPEIKLTADFSHWCVVCERLMDSELDVIQYIAPNIHHIHARVGYEQGPQVPHPYAPEYESALRAHQSWWELIWISQFQRGYESVTMTPEFGPDGYLHLMPFTQVPVADLWEINQWMAVEEKKHFLQFMQTYSGTDLVSD